MKTVLEGTGLLQGQVRSFVVRTAFGVEQSSLGVVADELKVPVVRQLVVVLDGVEVAHGPRNLLSRCDVRLTALVAVGLVVEVGLSRELLVARLEHLRLILVQEPVVLVWHG